MTYEIAAASRPWAGVSCLNCSSVGLQAYSPGPDAAKNLRNACLFKPSQGFLARMTVSVLSSCADSGDRRPGKLQKFPAGAVGGTVMGSLEEADSICYLLVE